MKSTTFPPHTAQQAPTGCLASLSSRPLLIHSPRDSPTHERCYDRRLMLYGRPGQENFCNIRIALHFPLSFTSSTRLIFFSCSIMKRFNTHHKKKKKARKKRKKYQHDVWNAGGLFLFLLSIERGVFCMSIAIIFKAFSPSPCILLSLPYFHLSIFSEHISYPVSFPSFLHHFLRAQRVSLGVFMCHYYQFLYDCMNRNPHDSGHMLMLLNLTRRRSH